MKNKIRKILKIKICLTVFINNFFKFFVIISILENIKKMYKYKVQKKGNFIFIKFFKNL